MTTPWKPSREWDGQTVAVLAAGPNMSQELAEALREHRTIAVNYAIRLAPWADMLMALDGCWPQEFREFSGLRVTGTADSDLDALYIGHRSESVTLRPGHVVTIRNSGLMAIRIAAEMGAARILLAGFAPEQPTHFDGTPTGGYIWLAEGLAQIVAELQANGIAVEYVGQADSPALKPRRSRR